MPAYIVTGLGYGDEGKGTITDYLVRAHEARGVVISNGGAQRAHNVVTPDGRHHTFSQFGSGTFMGAQTYFSKNALLNPHALFLEGEHLSELGVHPWRYIFADRDALVTTPFHVAANRVRELARGDGRHGSCGMGIGETIALSMKEGLEIRAGDLVGGGDRLFRMLEEVKHALAVDVDDLMRGARPGDPRHAAARTLYDPDAVKEAVEIYEIFAKVVPLVQDYEFDPDETWIFEGGQGVLLDEHFGFHPHTTWSDVTPSGICEKLLDRYPYSDVHTIGVMRSYMTRHGDGPFATEDESLHERFPEHHNDWGEWQGNWRVGWTDLAAMNYSLAACQSEYPIRQIAVTHMDLVRGSWKICTGYDHPVVPPSPYDDLSAWSGVHASNLEAFDTLTPSYVSYDSINGEQLINRIESQLRLPVTIASYGPTWEDKRARATTAL